MSGQAMLASHALSALLVAGRHALLASAQSTSSTATSTSQPADPTTPQISDTQSWLTAFIVIHSLSKNSWVYMYIFWLAIAFVFFSLCLATWSNVKGGSLGARWQKWALRRRTWRKKHALESISAEAKRQGVPVSALHKQPTALPSNAQILSATVLTVCVLLICFAGPDYVDPDINLFQFWSSYDSSSSSSTAAKRAAAVVVTDQSMSSYIAHYTINKSLWSLAARTGAVAFALFPLVVILALKTAPFALFAIPGLVGYGHDKMIRLHRYVGRLTWFVTFLHTIFWAVQACRERREETGQLVIAFIWQFQKFQFAWIAFIFMTILMICSLDCVRVPHYEVFYTVHVICTPLTIIFAALHHPQRSVWYWCLAALLMWVGERSWRLCIWIYVNGIFSRKKQGGVKPTTVQPYSYVQAHSQSTDALQHHRQTPSKGSAMTLIDPAASQYNSKFAESRDFTSIYAPSPRRPIEPCGIRLVTGDRESKYSEYTTPSRVSSPASTNADFDGYAAAPRPSEMLELARQESGHASRDHARGTPLRVETSDHQTPPMLPPAAHYHDSHSAPQSSISHSYPPKPGPKSASSVHSHQFLRAPPPQAPTYAPPPGFAHATLLPGRTIRLRLVTPGYQTWAPGQHFLVLIPCISRVATHPFTVASVCDEQAALRSSGAPVGDESGVVRTAEAGREILLIIRAKKGWTKRLWDTVSTLQEEGMSSYPGELSGTGAAPPEGTPGVILRTMVDGPFGSCSNTRWGSYASVLIVSGGSGVSFGMSVLEYICLCIAGRDGKFLGGRPGGWGVGPKGAWVTQRVRFVWLVREYAHIQWCVGALRRCLTIIPTDALEVNIFVSNFKPPRELLVSPVSGLAKSDDGHSAAHEDFHLKPPVPHFANPGKAGKRITRHQDDAQFDAAVGDIVDSYLDGYEEGGGEEDLWHETSALDYTNFDGDDDTPLPGENRLSRQIIKESKLRRFQSRKVKKAIDAKRELESRVVASQAHVKTQSDEWSQHKRFSTRTEDPLIPYPYRQSTSEATSPVSSEENDPFHFDQLAARRRTPPPTFPSFGSAVTELDSSPRKPDPRRLSMSSTSTFAMSPGASASTPVLRWLEPEPTAKGKGKSSGMGLTLNAQEVFDLQVVSEWAQPGKPKLGRILSDEVEASKGRVAVVCCGPTSLNALMRKHIAEKIDPDRIARGDLRGSIEFIAEDFEY